MTAAPAASHTAEEKYFNKALNDYLARIKKENVK